MKERSILDVKIQHNAPKVKEFIDLRCIVGWEKQDTKTASKALANTLFHVVARLDSKLIGMGRVIGDGAMFYYIQDVIVDPKYQSMGVGNLLMEKIEVYLSENANAGATVGLFSANGKETFYKKYGYLERDGSQLGFGMCKFL
ncbi:MULTISPECIES: GNAT family N-acetyltransferase [Pseudoalteromonas]|uniref:GNAT family N-acetyltransferase n=1 Tax=Pseudoalteromonas TaxID=53246 RepID=UPI00029AA818|nr:MULTISPECIES: GNAT family N-acetyltransferase [Pseudoalteromonas]AUJ71625.1 Acetyltransferase (GNAT) family protein [Pseudoalteromonas sp. NC201]MCF2828416.1 GNAT family N-acetyltransferase [Pseudoalteromonas sp. OF5H-5]MCF2833892.1 GNAT family N-acetyltransferase [Pseudoalteromonas sp. DL2-H6]MCF2924504.1 GNAT family N-acetyltransferase [Pseudoalteromonas sp. DL2-H1]MCF7514692.1 GNAT family N-acetyltransferase [Pseudoalteromonas sp. L7]